ncbi:hypothetical protein K8I61_09320 [bacterium]|nr:hypothetical protein [bacterium]
MAATEKIEVELPKELLRHLEMSGKDRSDFIRLAIEHELARQLHEGLRLSYENPHPESEEFAELGLADWAAGLPEGDEGLVDPSAGTPIRWVEGKGWVEETE